MTLELELTPELESWLHRTAARNGMHEQEVIIETLSRRRAEDDCEDLLGTLPDDEASLLDEIGEVLTPEIRARYQALSRKCEDEALTADEHQELIDLTSEVERHNTERLARVVGLARLRGASLEETMAQLGLEPASVI